MHPDPIVGIDLGTTNSLVAYCDERGPRVIPDELGRPLCPSVIKLTQNTAPASGDGAAPPFVATVGYEARESRRHATRGTFSSIKRFMGRGVGDNPGDLSYLSYEVVEGSNHAAMARVRAEPGQPADALSGRLFAMEELSAHILAKLREQVSRALGVPVRKAVITVPAYFDDAQRQATRAAGRLAGLEVLRLVNEPTAAALAYGLGLRRASARNTGDSVVAVYDLGGGTFDISILKLTSMPTGATGGAGGEAELAETSFFQVLATAGDTRLGGDDVDRMLAASVAAIAHPGVADPVGALTDTERQALIAACEQAKIALSDRTEASVDIELAGGRVVHTITRDQLDAIIAPWVERSIECCRRAMADASKKLAGAPIEVVVLVGGSSRIPLVRARVREFFGVEPYAALDPDQVVALGASVQASILAGATKGSLLLDVIPLSLGIETVGGAAAKLVMRNTTVPARAVEMFSTSVDGQTSIKLNIVQGEREMAADCRSLGVFHLRGLPPMPAGIPQVAVEFLVDANGVLNVSATERRSGKRAQVQVIPNHGLTSEDVERIEREAFAHAREDMTQHQVVDLIANSELDLKWIGDRLARHGSLLEADQRAALEGAIATLRDFTARARADWRSVNPTEFHRAKDALERASVRLQEISITQSLKSEKA